MLAQYFRFILIFLFLTDSLTENESHQKIREQKKNLVKKYMKKIRKQEGIIRLVNGRGDFEGNVEIHHMGKWGSICDDEWDMAEAHVACRYLGYEKARNATHNSFFGTSRKRIWMDNLLCDGEEKSLAECRFDGWGKSDCTESEGAGVVCESEEANAAETTDDPKPPKTVIKEKANERVSVRLRGGRTHNEGRVEVRIGHSEWGVICGDGWGLLEAMVVCRDLNMGYASAAIQTDYFGGNGSEIILSGIQCTGTEASLGDCLHHEMKNVNCPGKAENLAAVLCTNSMADLVIDHEEMARTIHLEDRQLYFLQCAMEENCLASQAYQLQKENSYNWHLETRRLLRFTARIMNIGTADFRPFVPKHLWEWHACHMYVPYMTTDRFFRHYHSMEVFATFDILNKNGVKVAEGHKASFCLEDNQCLPGIEPVFACANYGDQGISVNCSDIYRHNIDCQWIDITELDPGVYNIKVSINPEYKVAEMTFENNAALCTLYYNEAYAYVNNCTLQRP